MSCSNAGGAKQAPKGNSMPEIDPGLIRRANAAGTFIDYGDAGVRSYNRYAGEINEMELSDAEKQDSIKQLHSLITAQLEAESKSLSPYSAGVGPARFNASKMRRDADKAMRARQDVENFMDGLRQDQRKKKQQREQQGFIEAGRKALESGALSFTYNGETWVRKSKRSKTFTAQ